MIYVVQATEALIDIGPPAPPEKDVFRRALWTAAVVSYGRCFKKSQRKALDPDSLDLESLKLHQEFEAVRDKHIAHSDNAFEQARVAVDLDTGQLHTRVLYLWSSNKEHIDNLNTLAHTWIEMIAAGMNLVEQSIRSQLKRSDVEKLPAFRNIEHPDPGEVETRRYKRKMS